MNILSKSLLGVALSVAAMGLSGCGGGGPNPNPGGFGPTTLNGRLTTSSFYDSGTQRFYDIFVCDALSSNDARVAMRSSDFDTQLYIYEKRSDGSYKEISSNDDANSGTTDSDTTFGVSRGQTYRIVATSAKANADTGTYDIRFSDNLSTPAFVATSNASALKKAGKFVLPAAGKVGK